jgi:hypothetical protein
MHPACGWVPSAEIGKRQASISIDKEHLLHLDPTHLVQGAPATNLHHEPPLALALLHLGVLEGVQAAGVLEGGARGDGGGTVAGENSAPARSPSAVDVCAFSLSGSWGSKAWPSIGLDRPIRRGERANKTMQEPVLSWSWCG